MHWIRYGENVGPNRVYSPEIEKPAHENVAGFLLFGRPRLKVFALGREVGIASFEDLDDRRGFVVLADIGK